MAKSEENISKQSIDDDNTNAKLNEAVAIEMEDCFGKSLESLSTTFAASAKRWETVVYPALFAFVLLSTYGFYLIYNLTTDVRRVADSMDQIVVSMQEMSVNMNVVSHNMVLMTQTMDSQSGSMQEMAFHMRNMNNSMGQMRHDMSVMNNSVSRPMNFMNTFMPW